MSEIRSTRIGKVTLCDVTLIDRTATGTSGFSRNIEELELGDRSGSGFESMDFPKLKKLMICANSKFSRKEISQHRPPRVSLDFMDGMNLPALQTLKISREWVKYCSTRFSKSNGLVEFEGRSFPNLKFCSLMLYCSDTTSGLIYSNDLKLIVQFRGSFPCLESLEIDSPSVRLSTADLPELRTLAVGGLLKPYDPALRDAISGSLLRWSKIETLSFSYERSYLEMMEGVRGLELENLRFLKSLSTEECLSVKKCPSLKSLVCFVSEDLVLQGLPALESIRARRDTTESGLRQLLRQTTDLMNLKKLYFHRLVDHVDYELVLRDVGQIEDITLYFSSHQKIRSETQSSVRYDGKGSSSLKRITVNHAIHFTIENHPNLEVVSAIVNGQAVVRNCEKLKKLSFWVSYDHKEVQKKWKDLKLSLDVSFLPNCREISLSKLFVKDQNFHVGEGVSSYLENFDSEM